MIFGMRDRRAFGIALLALSLGGLMAAPVTAHADDPGKGKDGKKDGKIPIIIGQPTIVKDPTPNTPPKKDKK